MTRYERLRAFALREAGASYEEIGQELNYDAQTVAKDLRRVLDKQRASKILYPAVAAYVERECDGSVERLAHRLTVSPHRLRQVLYHGKQPTQKLAQKLSAALGISVEEVFRR